MTETKLLLTISNNIKLGSNETNKKFKVHHLCYTCIHFCLFVCLFCLFKMIKKLWTTQAASLHKLEAESSAAGRKLEEAVARGGEKPLLSIRGIFHFVSWRKVVITTNGLLSVVEDLMNNWLAGFENVVFNYLLCGLIGSHRLSGPGLIECTAKCCDLAPRLLTLYTLTSVWIFSILSSVHFQKRWQGEFV